MEKGNISLKVEEYWKNDETLEVDMKWQITITDASATAPSSSLVRKAIADYINKTSSPITLELELKMDPDTFEGSSSEASQALYRAASEAIVKKMATKLGIAVDDAEKHKENAIKSLKNILDKARK